MLGNEFAGEIEAVGGAVTQFARGDLVCGLTVTISLLTPIICLR
jgi:NADPH:quinone reductase-like Zn-dependent oxidoreductase